MGSETLLFIAALFNNSPNERSCLPRPSSWSPTAPSSASWGEPDRRFMCHSVRKSFVSALFGIYWDRGRIDLDKTLADLGLDDWPDPLLPSERQARIIDLLRARSGVFHPAAYAGRTDSRPRGSQGPGRFFAYNNWDFNTLATILEQETGARVFEAFDGHFAWPLGMQDFRVSDGYYHFERDKSRFPAYPFRMSARDAARFGLLFAREGTVNHNVFTKSSMRMTFYEFIKHRRPINMALCP